MKQLAELQVTIAADVLKGLMEERGSRLAHLISRGEYRKDDQELVLLARLIEEAENNYEEAIERLNSYC